MQKIAWNEYKKYAKYATKNSKYNSIQGKDDFDCFSSL